VFDKITIRATVSAEECVHLAQLHHLHVWTNDVGTQVEYRSSEYGKLSGIDVQIKNNKLTLKCSLHKFWELRNFGKLRNDTLFSISEAKAAFEMLLFENGLVHKRVRIAYFEIGLNMNVTLDPLSFIELIQFISFKDKIWFVDANYRINRQKTTEKYKDIRKYYKIYDKSWETEEKRRSSKKSVVGSGQSVESGKQQAVSGKQKEYILRIETVYKRHNERSDKFMSDDNLRRLVNRFWVDWKDLFFLRQVRAYKGARKSEVERARIIINEGAEEYLQRMKEELKQKRITEKQFRTIREFIRDYDERDPRFRIIVSQQEKEYNSLIQRVYDHCKT